MVTLQFEIENVPNFIKLSRNTTPCMLPIGDLTEEEVNEYAEKFKAAILQNWRNKKLKSVTNE